MSRDIGLKIKSAIDDHRIEAERLRQAAEEIEDAWEDGDWKLLYGWGIISAADYRDLLQED